MDVKTYVATCLGSMVLALLTTPVVIRIAWRLRAVDHPGVRAMHTKPVPRIGGWAIFVSSMCLVVSVLFLDNTIGEAFRDERPRLVALWVVTSCIFAIGLIDDLRGLPATAKLAAEVVGAGVLYAAGVRITELNITDTFGVELGWMSGPLTVLWIVGITNAVNLSDGLDGLAAGIAAVACAVIAMFAIYSDNAIMAVFMLALLGSLIGFLFFNFNPARVFMGDCGSLFLGFTIAASSVICLTKSSALVGLTLPVLALGIPILDTFFAMLRRFLDRRSLFAPDRNHFHHRLIELGLKQRHAVVAIYAATCLATGFGLFMMVRRDAGSLVVFGCILLLLVLLFRMVGAVRFRETLLRLQEQYALKQHYRREQKRFEFLQLRFRQVGDPRSWWRAICEAAQQFNFAWVAMHVKDPDGKTDTSIWRAREDVTLPSRIVVVTLPLSDPWSEKLLALEVAILVHDSLESASHRAGLFSRLIEECTSARPAVRPGLERERDESRRPHDAPASATLPSVLPEGPPVDWTANSLARE